MNNITDYLKELGLNTGEIRAYQALAKLGEAPASQIAKSANMPRTTAISILEKLILDKLVSAHKYKGKTFYWIESPQAFMDSLNVKLEIAKEMDIELRNIYKSEGVFPAVEVHDTISGIRSFIEKIVSNSRPKSIIYTIDSPNKGNYSKIYPEKKETTLLNLKKKKDIHTLTLIPYGSFKDIASYKLSSQHITLKELPPGIDFESSMWLINDKLVHFSGNPPFIVAIKHQKIIESFKQLFDYLWNVSRSVK